MNVSSTLEGSGGVPDIAMTRRVDLPYAEAVERIKAALKDEGFGVLTEIDVRATLQAKLGADFRDYTILGACNPALALRALEADLRVGTLLPCNVVVYAEPEGGSVIAIFDPEVGLSVLESDALEAVGCDARERLQRALNQV